MGSFGETIVVTGFGPFGQHLVNQSWTAAQGLKAEGLEEVIEIYIKEIPVSYSSAKRILSGIWEKVQPEFAVHLGIAPGSKAITLEQTGKNYGYVNRDVCGQCPLDHCCVEGGVDKLDSIINMRSLTKKLRAKGLDVIYSKDAGSRYLCDFTYYWSLHCGRGRAAFIHVPASGSLATPDNLVPQLSAIIQAMLRELRALSDNTVESTTDQSAPEEGSQHLI
ncbi:pyroglutamyl-peptidase 1 isoform X1 [Alosa pseudoharengus]|uniref:pyroglutamyl-peptidase 1 isoform X1 n=1 Tax=Alosa pseudoharengus TaxID=34774 RepID=UPI003F898A45